MHAGLQMDDETLFPRCVISTGVDKEITVHLDVHCFKLLRNVNEIPTEKKMELFVVLLNLSHYCRYHGKDKKLRMLFSKEPNIMCPQERRTAVLCPQRNTGHFVHNED